MRQALSIVVQLVHIHGPMKGRIQEFGSNEISIGRHPSCDLQFPKDLVVISRTHARILREGNRFKIIDTSTNGTFVNGARITEAWLKNGDVIFFTQGGPKISFLTREGEVAPAPEPLSPVQEPVSQAPSPVWEAPEPPVSANNGNPAPRPVSQSPAPPSPPPQPGFYPEPSAPAQPIIEPSPAQGLNSPSPTPSLAEPSVKTVQAPLVIQYGAVLKSFSELPVTIGSQPDCDFVLEHPSVTGPQVQIYFSQGSYRIKDLTGRNQMRINDRQAASPSPLMPGDRLLLTPAGPGFQFLEGGRMAEISLPRSNEPSPDESVRPETAPRAKEKPRSLFKKIFR